MPNNKSKSHWRLYEKKCPLPLWQNTVLVQYFIPQRCQLLVLAPSLVWGHLWGANATTHVQKPLKIIWEKVPLLLWQNRVLVQHFSPQRCQLLVLALTLVWGHLCGWNETTQVQKPLNIIWENVPKIRYGRQGLGATLHSPEVPITSVGPDTSMKAPLGMEWDNMSPKTIENYMKKSAHFRMAE
jgi:hypothetical protein